MVNETPRSSLLRGSSHFGYEGQKLRGIRRRKINEKPSATQPYRETQQARLYVAGIIGGTVVLLFLAIATVLWIVVKFWAAIALA